MVSFKRELCSRRDKRPDHHKSRPNTRQLPSGRKGTNANRNRKVHCMEENQFTTTLSVLPVLSLVAWSEIPKPKLLSHTQWKHFPQTHYTRAGANSARSVLLLKFIFFSKTLHQHNYQIFQILVLLVPKFPPGLHISSFTSKSYLLSVDSNPSLTPTGQELLHPPASLSPLSRYHTAVHLISRELLTPKRK